VQINEFIDRGGKIEVTLDATTDRNSNVEVHAAVTLAGKRAHGKISTDRTQLTVHPKRDHLLIAAIVNSINHAITHFCECEQAQADPKKAN